MKKLFAALVAGLVAFGAFAQQPAEPAAAAPAVTKAKAPAKKHAAAKKHKSHKVAKAHVANKKA